MNAPIVRRIHPENPQPEIILQAAEIVKNGGVVVFPTRCLYGLGADAWHRQAVDRIFAIKQRSEQNPILVLIDHPGQLAQLAKRIPDAAARLMERFWPGRITLVLEARDTVPANLTAHTGKIGVRMPGHAVALALVKAVPGPITGTSANLSGRPGCHRIDDLDAQIAGQPDLILDAGRLKGGIGSTVVDVTDETPLPLVPSRQGRGNLTFYETVKLIVLTNITGLPIKHGKISD
jgi:L-threonylcarbamoyladenylate synthase